jgi:hypothetical protein
MIKQLVQRWAAGGGPGGGGLPGGLPQAVADVITADPFDLVLHMEQVWDAANLWLPNPGPAGPARQALIATNQFFPTGPPVNTLAAPQPPHWDHLGFAFAVETTRAAQIMARVVRAFRAGEGLGIPSYATQRWLDTTETLLFNAGNPIGAWLSTSSIRPDAEAVRRNAYYRLFGMDLAHGTDSNAAFTYDKSDTANKTFVQLFEELLNELWRAIENVRNFSGANAADDDRIFRLSEQISFMLRSRRQNALLGREELAAVTAMGWLDLTLSANTPVVTDLRADATSSADRLRFIGERVGLAPHSKAASFFSMAEELSVFLRYIEAGVVQNATQSWVFYLPPPGPGGAVPIGPEVRRVITEWSAASGRDLKVRARPVEVRSRPSEVTATNGRVPARR